MTDEEALQLGETFGVVVGEVDEELRDYLGLQRAEGVVVFEVIGGKPADLAGIKAKVHHQRNQFPRDHEFDRFRKST